MQYDALIVGGGIAGLQAALTLSRQLYKVALVDAGQQANRAAPHMHNMIGAEGMTAEAFYARAHEQLAGYPDLERVQARVVDANADGSGGFHVVDDAGRTYQTRSLLFACGVKDVLPPIEGIEALWGKEVQHCAYCHGYEKRGLSAALLTPNDSAMAMIRMVHHLVRSIHLLLEDGTPDPATKAQLEALSIGYDTAPINYVERSEQGIRMQLADGQFHEFGVLFIRPEADPQTLLPKKLGCTMHYGQVKLNEYGQTGVDGLYVAGDMASGSVGQLVSAMKSGLDTAVAMHQYLRVMR